MKERPILFNGPMVRALLEGRKTVTRRIVKPQPNLLYGITDDIIYVYHTGGYTYEYERNPSGERSLVEGHTRIPERGLYGGVGWTNLLKNQVQGLWSQGIRGLVLSSWTPDEKGLSNHIDESQQYQSNKEHSSLGMFRLSRVAPEQGASGKAPGWESREQQTRKSSLGDTGGELGRQTNSRNSHNWREALGSKANGFRAGTLEVGNQCWIMQPEKGGADFGDVARCHLAPCPFQIGQTLWVRETWQLLPKSTDVDLMREYRYQVKETDQGIVTYKASNIDGSNHGWRPSIHMPRWASRITLEITGVRVERLQDINEGDALAEGLYTLSDRDGTFYNYNSEIESRYWWVDPISAFVALWQSINGKRPGYNWNSNPLVWVIEFKRIESETK